ncbi:STAS domain-containing protein [Actinoallomurus purpureus]|uniref:STAS domain-containing protein n=1 Tax=Actinoallomurus purpureus TaxID=478114 RepID=UPI00209329CF|nr:STAS domain-containing protein [Actinoallomurus purpureus]MCO6005431.1 STAS domain-containing protein [Actinoallomurus purpureus]
MHSITVRARLFSRRLPGHTVIAVRGELDIATTPAVRDRILTILDDTTTPLVIDLSGVSFCDASGLAMLIGTQRRARSKGVTIALAAPRPIVRKMLRITGLDRAFAIHSTLASAQAGYARLDHLTAA